MNKVDEERSSHLYQIKVEALNESIHLDKRPRSKQHSHSLFAGLLAKVHCTILHIGY